MKTERPYVMRARADATERTRQRVLRAVVDLSRETMSLEIVLAAVAERAEVSVQTILRHFGSKEGLFDAVEAFAQTEVVQERTAPAGDVEAIARVLLDHYESAGDWTLAILAQEGRSARARRVTDRGRVLHREWVGTVFAPQLCACAEPDRLVLTDLLVVATDVYTWKLWRRDRHLDRAEVQHRLVRLVRGVLRTTEG